MEVSEKVRKGFNKQINAEFYASYLYLSMSAYFESEGLKGFAGWMRKQAEEEREHAMKFYKHLVERGSRVELTQIDGPKTEWKSALEAAQDALGHEKKVTKMIHDLVVMSEGEKDYAANNLLQWFVDEQVEEEEQTRDMIKKIEMVDKSTSGLLMLDKMFGKRVKEE